MNSFMLGRLEIEDLFTILKIIREWPSTKLNYLAVIFVFYFIFKAYLHVVLESKGKIVLLTL